MAGEIAAFDFEAEAMAQQAVNAAKADGIAQAGVQHPEQIAVRWRVVVLAVAPETGDAVVRGKEPLGQFMRIHAAFFGKGFLRQCVEALCQISGLGLPAIQESRKLAQALFKLRVRPLHPAPAHPGFFEFEPSCGFEQLRHQPFLLRRQRRLQGLNVLRQLPAHAVELLPHRLPHDFRVVVEQFDEMAQVSTRRHLEVITRPERRRQS